jgi:succinoglycan biosynthesis protein ExoV
VKLYSYEVPGGNFGDDLNHLIWDALLPGWREWAPEVTLVGVGTLLGKGGPPPGRKLVLGSGTGYGALPDVSDAAEWDVRAVRGPLTAARLGLPPERAAVDPAALLPETEGFRPEDLAAFGGGEAGEVVFVPHHASVERFDWAGLCAEAGIGYQTPQEEVRAVVGRLSRARAVVAESMHAAIVADAYGVPWRAVAVTRGFNRFKWEDWARSLEMAAPRATRFFEALRRAQDASLALRGRRGERSDDGMGSRETGEGALMRRLGPVLRPFAVRRLRAEARGPFALSDREASARACDRLRAALDGARADYAPSGEAGVRGGGAGS